MEQLVLLVIIGLISLVNWVMQKAAEKREQAESERAAKGNVFTQPPPTPVRTPRPRTAAQDPFKELMEALGLPSEGPPPAPVARRAQPVAVEEEEFASVEDAGSPPLPASVRGAGPVRVRWQPPVVSRPDAKTAQLASAFAAGETPSGGRPGLASIRGLLADRSSKRHAVILAEILGAPRGLSPVGFPAAGLS